MAARSFAGTRSPSWTKTPVMFGNELRRLALMHAANGLVVVSKRCKKARLIACSDDATGTASGGSDD